MCTSGKGERSMSNPEGLSEGPISLLWGRGLLWNPCFTTAEMSSLIYSAPSGSWCVNSTCRGVRVRRASKVVLKRRLQSGTTVRDLKGQADILTFFLALQVLLGSLQ